MLIRLKNESYVDDFCLHFLRSGFDAEHAGGVMVEVRRRGATPVQERRDIEAHLRIWNAMNPGADAKALT